MSFEDLTKREALAELRQISRLHEEATNRNVELSAIIAAIGIQLDRAEEQHWTSASIIDATRELIRPGARAPRSLRIVKHKLLVDLARELDEKNVAGNVSIGSSWLRARALGELTGTRR
jgi:hypothetical protein